jgi:hypothetical protein
MSKIKCGFMAAGLLAVSLPILAATTIGAGAATVPGAAQDSAIDTPATAPTDFSSARMGGGGGRGGGFGGGGRGGGGRVGGFGGGGRVGGRTGGGGRVGGRTGGGRVGGRTGGGRVGGRTGGGRVGGRTGGGRVGAHRVGGTRVGGTHTGGARTGGTRVGGTRTGGTRVGGTRVGGRVGRTTSIRNRRISTFSGRRFWYRGGWRVLIGISLLTGYAIGPDFYYPEGYVALAEPVCTGYTDDGCALRWQDVAADDGSTIPQCVEFCPRVRREGAVPAAAPVAAAPRQGCEVEVYQDKNLAGASFKTTEDQPLLNDQWDKRISSINVISGTWDFATEQQYGGDAMRLAPGSYRDLGSNWDDQISSFMCTQ